MEDPLQLQVSNVLHLARVLHSKRLGLDYFSHILFLFPLHRCTPPIPSTSLRHSFTTTNPLAANMSKVNCSCSYVTSAEGNISFPRSWNISRQTAETWQNDKLRGYADICEIAVVIINQVASYADGSHPGFNYMNMEWDIHGISDIH